MPAGKGSALALMLIMTTGSALAAPDGGDAKRTSGSLFDLTLGLEEMAIRGQAAKDVDARDEDGWTPLMRAVRNDMPDLARTLLAAGADPEAVDPSGRTALILAAEEGGLTGMFVGDGGGTDCLRLLLEAGARVDARDAGGDTALMKCCRWHLGDAEEKMRLLLEAGADVDMADGEGVTPLMAAASLPDGPALVRLLLAAGADVHAVDNNGENALDRCGQDEAGAETARMLRAAGAR